MACCSKVFLGYKKSNPDQVYAIKVMKKSEMVNKNMACQGNSITAWCVSFFHGLFNNGFICQDCILLDSRMIVVKNLQGSGCGLTEAVIYIDYEKERP
jgi:hypothetical protein